MADTIDGEVISVTTTREAHLKKVGDDLVQAWKGTIARAAASRKTMRGDYLPPMAAEFIEALGGMGAGGGLDGAQQDGPAHGLIVKLPQKTTGPLRMRNILGKLEPRPKRNPPGVGMKADENATNIEQTMGAVMANPNPKYRYPWVASIDKLMFDGLCTVITIPDAADWKKSELRREFKKGREDATDGDYARYLDQWKADHQPVRFKAYGPESALPILDDDDHPVGVMTITTWTINRLFESGYVWEEKDKLMSPAVGGFLGGSAGGSYGVTSGLETRTLYGLWSTSWEKDGPHPFVAYSIDGCPTYHTRKGKEVDAIIDLRKEYGIERPTFAFRFGQRFYDSNPDNCSVPFITPYAQGYRAIEGMLTSINVHSFWRAYPVLIEQLGNAPALPESTLAPDKPPTAPIIGPLRIIRLRGTVKELGTEGVSDDVYKLVDVIMGSNDKEIGSAGQDAPSGFAATVDREYSEDALSDTERSAKELWEESASFAFEILTKMGRKKSIGPIPISANIPVPIDSASKRDTTSKLIYLRPEWAGGVYQIHAEMPPRPNLALGQQWAEWVDKGLVLRKEFREKIIGDTAPHVFEAGLMVQRIRDLPEGLARVVALAMRINGDEEEAAEMEAISQGAAATAGPEGVVPANVGVGIGAPSAALLQPQGAMMPPAGVGMPGGAIATGMSQGSIPQSALAGVVGGAMSAGPVANVERAGFEAPMGVVGG